MFKRSQMSYSFKKITNKLFEKTDLYARQKRELAEATNIIEGLTSKLEGVESAPYIPDLSMLQPKDIYELYYRLSSDMSMSVPIDVQTSVARSVWEEGGDEGIEHKKSHSHWLDSKNFSQKFEQWGERCREVIERHPKFPDHPKNLVIAEYGSGGGSVLNALKPLAKELHGFDISQSNLDECVRVLGKKFSPHLVSDNLDSLEHSSFKADIFVSFNVFQHFPSRAYAENILKFIASSTKSGGIAVIDIRFDNGNPKYIGYSIDQYNTKVGHTYPNCIRIDLFVQMLERSGFSVDCIGMIGHQNNMANFWVTKR